LARDSGRIYAARQSDGTIVAAVFCAWDTSTAYYLMTTRTLASGNSAVTLLLWKAISDATARGLIFDFDGVASAGAVLFYAGFGGQVQPRYIVSKGSDFLQMLNRLRRVVGKRKSPFN
jgi:hypothetical protein